MNTDEFYRWLKERDDRIRDEQRAWFVEATRQYGEGCAEGKHRFLVDCGLISDVQFVEVRVVFKTDRLYDSNAASEMVDKIQSVLDEDCEYVADRSAYVASSKLISEETWKTDRCNEPSVEDELP